MYPVENLSVKLIIRKGKYIF